MDVTRRKLLRDSARLAAGATALPLVGRLPAAAAASPGSVAGAGEIDYRSFVEADYWAFADHLAEFFDPLWEPSRSYYKAFGGGQDTRYNGAVLTTHSIAALAGHTGLARQDDRARQLARRLCQSPPFVETRPPGPKGDQFHVPGWVESLRSSDAPMHVANDPQVAEGLAMAWRAREVIGLDAETVALIEDRISRVATGSFFRYPAVRLNQINWQAEMYSHAATVTGDPTPLVSDYRKQVERFATNIKRRRRASGSTNLTRTYRFQYLPDKAPTAKLNLDSAEYANVVANFMAFHRQALDAGMRPLRPAHRRLLRAWVERLVCGYWTHGGYLNWDTGFNLERWQLGQYWSLALQGLLGVAVADEFHARPELGGWAKFIFDRGLDFYARLADGNDPLGLTAPGVVYSQRGITPSRLVFASRMQANAARAVLVKLGERTGKVPPPFYAFDPDIGRLAISTPTYNTAVLPVNQRATPYGGIELARLYDADQNILSNIAGRPPAAHGVMVTGPAGRRVLASQFGRARAGNSAALVLTKSPRGVVRRGEAWPRRPYAGRFGTLEARGTVASGDLRLSTTHRFRSDSIETVWKLTRRSGRKPYTAGFMFPSYTAKARVEAVLRGGQRVVLAGPGRPGARVALGRVSYFHVTSGDAGYVVVPARRSSGVARVVSPTPQATAETPGPTLVVEPARNSRFRTLQYTARIGVAKTRSRAAEVARALGAS